MKNLFTGIIWTAGGVICVFLAVDAILHRQDSLLGRAAALLRSIGESEKQKEKTAADHAQGAEPAAIPAPGKTMGEYLVERSQLQNKIITLVESGTGLSLLYKEIIEEPNVNAEAKWKMYEEKQARLRVLLTEFDALKDEATKQNPDSSMQFRELAGRRFYEELVKFSRDAMDQK